MSRVALTPRGIGIARALSLLPPLMTAASAGGLLDRRHIHRTEELQLAFVPKDLVNLAVGLAPLLGSFTHWRAGGPRPTEIAVRVADFAVSPAYVVAGFLLWRRKAYGYAAAVGRLR